MSVIELYSPAGTGWKKLITVPHNIFALLRERVRHAHMLTELSRLDDRLLNDIGLDLLDLQSVKEERSRLRLVSLATRLGRSGGG